MKKLFFNLIIVIASLMIFSSCSSCNGIKTDNIKNNSNEKLAITFLKSKGYNLVSKDGEVSKYVLKKNYLLKLPYQQYWGVQKINPDKYINKTIETYKFIINNHPLDNYKNNKNKQTIAWIMICDNKVIGGYSLPDVENFSGGAYSLDGKTIEETTGLSFQNWLKQWTKKYS